MTDFDNTSSIKGPDNSGLPPAPPNPEGASSKPFASGSDPNSSFKTWLGPKGYKQFLSTLSQFINNEMKKNEAQIDLANRKLAATEKGEDPDDITE